MDFHPISTLFPLMDGKDFDDLKRDIAKNGLVESIWLHPNGQIIDGRNRWRACSELGIKPDFRTWNSDGSLVDFVVSLNLHRRHLTSSQRATVSLAALPMLEAEARERQLAGKGEDGSGGRGNVKNLDKLFYQGLERAPQSIDKAAELFDTNRQYVSDAKRIQDEAPDVFEQVKSGELSIPKAKEEIRKNQSIPKVIHNAGDNEWYTPKQYIEAAIMVMEYIDLDPASSEVANELIGAKHIYTIENSGLNYNWYGNVWLNPPYARELVGEFINKLVYHFENSDIIQAITLTNNSTETKWFQAVSAISSAICLPEERVKFWHPRKEAVPLQGQAILYLGKNIDSFVEQFNQFGVVWTR